MTMWQYFLLWIIFVVYIENKIVIYMHYAQLKSGGGGGWGGGWGGGGHRFLIRGGGGGGVTKSQD